MNHIKNARHILVALSFALQFLEPVHQNQFRLVVLDHETENDPLEHRLRFRGKSNGWELNCGDEIYRNVYRFELHCVQYAKLVTILPS